MHIQHCGLPPLVHVGIPVEWLPQLFFCTCLQWVKTEGCQPFPLGDICLLVPASVVITARPLSRTMDNNQSHTDIGCNQPIPSHRHGGITQVWRPARCIQLLSHTAKLLDQWRVTLEGAQVSLNERLNTA